MINVTEILLCKYRDYKSIKQISKETGHSKNTVQYYLRGYDDFVKDHHKFSLYQNNFRYLIEEYILNIRFKAPSTSKGF